MNSSSQVLYRPFRDPLFFAGCAAYAVNRWLIKPRVPAGFMPFHFNDLWLIPCALPPTLWLYGKAGLRPPGLWPTQLEVVLHFLLWSVLCEIIGPRFLPSSQGDWKDIAAYAAGALVASGWWHRARRLQLPPS